MKRFTLLLALVFCSSAFAQKTDSISFIPGKHLKKGFIGGLFLGRHYRPVWTTPVKARVLDLNAMGLKPVESGGRLETKSLKLEDKEGRDYVARSVEKDLSKALPEQYRSTFAGKLMRDHNAANEPFAALIVKDLAKAINILHCSPNLYVLPNDASLGEFQKEYGGMAVMLEERPAKSWKKHELFGKPDKMWDTEELIQKRISENNFRVDEHMYLKGRLLDILIGDWSRHDEQYKWAMIKGDDGKLIARPIPRDRDHAFYSNEGLLNKVSLAVFPFPKDFEEKIEHLNHLNHMAGNMDRLFLPGISYEQWNAITTEFLSQINDKVIEAAVKNLPPETYKIDGKEIESILKERLTQMKKVSDLFYKQTNKDPFIPGTDKKDRFVVEIIDIKTVKVEVFAHEKDTTITEAWFSRTFTYPDSKKITLAALRDEDILELKGKDVSKLKIRVAFLAGPGEDEVKNELATVPKRITYYDTKPRKIYDYMTSGIKNESRAKKVMLKKK